MLNANVVNFEIDKPMDSQRSQHAFKLHSPIPKDLTIEDSSRNYTPKDSIYDFAEHLEGTTPVTTTVPAPPSKSLYSFGPGYNSNGREIEQAEAVDEASDNASAKQTTKKTPVLKY